MRKAPLARGWATVPATLTSSENLPERRSSPSGSNSSRSAICPSPSSLRETAPPGGSLTASAPGTISSGAAPAKPIASFFGPAMRPLTSTRPARQTASAVTPSDGRSLRLAAARRRSRPSTTKWPTGRARAAELGVEAQRAGDIRPAGELAGEADRQALRLEGERQSLALERDAAGELAGAE